MRSVRSILFFALALMGFEAVGQEAAKGSKVVAELLFQSETIAAGKPFWAAVSLKPKAPWKIYWRNPGDTGLPTQLQWQLPFGWRAEDTRWPVPMRFEFQGLVSFGYDREAVLLAKIHPPANLEARESFPLGATVSWLACHDICVRGGIKLSRNLQVGSASGGGKFLSGERISAALSRLPMKPASLKSRFEIREGNLLLTVSAQEGLFENTTGVLLLPMESGLVSASNRIDAQWSPKRLEIVAALEEAGRQSLGATQALMILQRPGSEDTYHLDLVPSSAWSSGAERVADGGPSLASIIALSILGGLLLNLMPCVFPVLSLKAIGLVESVNLPTADRRLHGIFYTLGVMGFFSAVGGVFLLLRAAGESIGWGFQLQTPWFVALLVYVLTLLGLNFSGLLTLGGSAMGVGDSLTRGSGYSGSFFTGALAAVVASPCTAPFMGSAVAYAITQPPVYALPVFIGLAFGMALPFLLLAFVPNIGKFLPRPGPWMQVFKQAMAFPLYLTAIWLLWVLGRETDITSVAAILVGLLLLLFATWLYSLGSTQRIFWRYFNRGTAGLAVTAALALLLLPGFHNSSAMSSKAAEDFWEPYSGVRLAELRSKNLPVFVNMTADWCISCIANERVALSMPRVRSAFRAKGVVPLKGDWTNNDPEVTQVLKSFNREGVPLYILYPGDGTAPVLLPQWLTPFNVLKALEAI